MDCSQFQLLFLRMLSRATFLGIPLPGRRSYRVISFFGISSCARYDGHVSVDLLPNLLKGTAKRIQQIMVCLLSICLSIYMTFISVQFTLTQFEGGNTSISIAIPIWVIYLSTCIGFFLMSYVYVRKLAGMLKKTGGRNNEGEDKVC